MFSKAELEELQKIVANKGKDESYNWKKMYESIAVEMFPRLLEEVVSLHDEERPHEMAEDFHMAVEALKKTHNIACAALDRLGYGADEIEDETNEGSNGRS